MHKRKGRVIFNLLVILTVALMIHGSGFAQGPDPRFQVTPLTSDSTFQTVKAAPTTTLSRSPATESVVGDKLVSVIVKLDAEPLATYRGGVPGLAPTSPEATGAPQLDLKSPSSLAYLEHLAKVESTFEATAAKALSKVQVTHRFDVILGGVSLLVPADQISLLAKLPGVKGVYPDELLQIDTDNSPKFIGAPSTWNQLGGQESAGEGVIVGVLDTGIWPEHPSFSDPDPSGKPYAVPPPPVSGTRACQFSGGANPGAPFTCNNKLIGAWRFMSTYQALNTLLPDEYTSARDDDGHGTHTSSTSAGNANVAASIFGVSRGKISGIAPRAHVIMYKVCGEVGCYSSDSAAAVQQAIKDGVNAINFSIGGGTNPYADAVSLAFLDAYNAGVFVAASAGNSGPGADTTGHREPWVTTVAASTQNRAFENTATVTADGGASLTLRGASITGGVGPAPVFVPPSDPLCNSPFAAGSVAGQIVVCRRGTTGRAEKGYNVLQGGAVGMILYNNAANVTDLETDNHWLPTSHIQYADGQALLSFIAANTNVQATLTPGAKVSAQGDVMASFSSRGGPAQTLGISKPDITAPGVQVLAGHSPQHMAPPAGVALGPQGELFQSIAGTSMSSPHIAGAGALLKALYPSWTPGQIKSALMMTAKTSKVFKEDGVTLANAFDYGSGRVDLSKAWKAWGTISATGADYVAHQNDLWNANYPSLYVPAMPGSITVQRTLHNEEPFAYGVKLRVQAPRDVKITVPNEIYLPANGNATFEITVDGRDVPLGETRMAMLTLFKDHPDYPVMHFPITFVRKQAPVTLTKSCDPASFARGSATTCTLTMVNGTFSTANVNLTDALPRQLQLVAGSVVGGVADGNGVKFTGTLAGLQPPDVAIGPGTSPAGYLPLSLFGIAPISGVTDDSVTNFNVPAFTYAGETYTRLGVGSNGYLIVGGGTGSADVQFLNQNLPNATRPNNVLSPFWTDLNPPAGGAIRIATLTDGADTWIVVDWAAVREFSQPRTATFEIWIGLNTDANPGEDISFAYGAIQGNGDGGFLTVGAENKFGNRGANFYYNGAGTLPAEGTELRVTGTPGVPGEVKTITFQAKGVRTGAWTNYALLTADIFQGTNIARFAGTVTP